MNIVISDAKTSKAFSKKTDGVPQSFKNHKIGDVLRLDEAGLAGYEARITGGSDSEGFPMHRSIAGSNRRKILSLKGVGFRQAGKGVRLRKSVSGNTVSEKTAQLNVVVTKEGTQPFAEFLAAPKVKEEKRSAREVMVEKSLAAVGDEEVAAQAKEFKKAKQ